MNNNEKIITDAQSHRALTKIAFFLPDLRIGGAEHVMAIIASEMAERGYPVDFVLVKAQGGYLESLSPSVSVVDLDRRSAYLSLGRLLRYFREAKPDILLSALDLTNMIAIIARMYGKYPKQHFVRLSNTQSAVKRNPLKKLLEKWLIKMLYPGADGFIAVSDSVAEDFCDYAGIQSHALRTIYNPIITADFDLKANEIPDHPWLSPKTLPVILSVGRLSEQKNFDLLIHAFAKLLETTQARLIILGEGNLRKNLSQLCSALNVQDFVDMPGVVANPYSYMKNVDLFVLSSNYEGLPNALVEALASGCSIVSTDCTSGPREILDGGKFGRLVPVGDADALTKAMRDTLREGSYPADAQWLGQFQVESVVDQYLAFMGLPYRTGDVTLG